jgi:hypothetical protein
VVPLEPHFLMRSMPITEITEYRHPISGAREDYDALLDLVGNRRFVLSDDPAKGRHQSRRLLFGFRQASAP